MNYDPEARRDTPLASKLKDRIRRDGAISVADYMAACLYDAEHGYYRTASAIGAAGDFVTAPEISQIFGELLGLWAAVVWTQLGRPKVVQLAELGPGRGTLMADALRATRRVPGFHDAVRLVLVESSARLRGLQEASLAGATVDCTWLGRHEALASAAAVDLPLIVIGNEFLDCEPRNQIVRRDGSWYLRRVGLDGLDRLIFDDTKTASAECAEGLDQGYPAAVDGAIVEQSVHSVVATLAVRTYIAALFIDYGHIEPLVGDTLQAVRNHRFEHPLTSPGEADLTMQVDFAALGRAVGARPALAIDGPLTQGEFLGGLGILERASRLMAANPGKAPSIEAAVARLLSPTGMGMRFKAIGLRSVELPILPGFESMDNRGRLA